MTKSEIIKDFLKKSVLTFAVAFVLYWFFISLCTKNGETDYLLLWILCGIPFGIRRMFMWLIPHNYDLAGTIGIWALNFIVGGIIGGFILIWRIAVAIYYIPLTIIRFISESKTTIE